MAKRLRDKSEGWKDIVGNPDGWDRKNIETCIKNFCAEKFRKCQVYEMECETETCPHPKMISGTTWIRLAMEATRAQADLEAGAVTFNQFGMKNKEAESRLVTSLPGILYARISDTMPTVFRDKDHLAWFVKNFKGFLVPPKF